MRSSWRRTHNSRTWRRLMIQDLAYSVDGVDCTDQIDFTVHPADGDLSWDSMWGEDTGSFTKDSCIRAVGGYNEVE